jgi:hypothetical protein
MSYITFNRPATYQTILTGVRHAKKDKYKKSHEAFITGFYKTGFQATSTGFIYKGPLNAPSGTFYDLVFPNTYTTSPYGPDRISDNKVAVVGNYVYEQDGNALGFLFKGDINDTQNGTWLTIVPPFENAVNTICHSIMNDVCVGNYASTLDLLDISQTIQDGIGAFVYVNKTNKYYKITKKHATSITAYGIWHLKENHYTIAGSYRKKGLVKAYIVTFNDGKFSNWKSFKWSPTALLTHFDGITGTKTGYHFTGLYIDGADTGAFYAKLDHHENIKWTKVSYPSSAITSGNTVIDDKVLGIYDTNPSSGYVATF